MFKKFAAFGLSAALVLSPLAAFAQTDAAAPAAPAAGARARCGRAGEGEAEAPREEAHEQEDEGACGPRRPGSAEELIGFESDLLGRVELLRLDGAAFLWPLFRFARAQHHANLALTEGAPDGRREVLVRIRQHLLLSGGDARRSARGGARRRADLAPFSLGPILAANGWRDSPFNIYPSKGR